MQMRIVLMLLGFTAAFTGDWFLVIRRCGVKEPGFLCGIAAFACAHLLWSAANWRESKVEWKTLPVVLLPLLGFFTVRVHGRIPDVVFVAASVYAVISACSLAVAIGTRRWFYSLGIGCLVLSDVFIACTWVRAPHWGSLIGPTYVAALILVAGSLVCGRREARFACGKGNPLPAGASVEALSPDGRWRPVAEAVRGGFTDLDVPLGFYEAGAVRIQPSSVTSAD